MSTALHDEWHRRRPHRARRRARHRGVGTPRGRAPGAPFDRPARSTHRRRLAWRRLAVYGLAALFVLVVIAVLLLPAGLRDAAGG